MSLSLGRRDLLRAAIGAAAMGCRRSAEPSRVAPPSPHVDPRWDRVVQTFETSLAATPGGAVGVILDDKPVFAVARGVRSHGAVAPVTTSTLFRLESVTKTFTALTALSLVEQHALDLDAPVSDLVPSVSFSDPAVASSVTLRRLLTHTAGISRNQIPRLRDVRRGSEYDDLFRKNVLSVGALDRFEYSNTGYLLVGAAIERAAKTSFDEVLRTKVTQPIGMVTATSDSAVAATREHADGFGLDEDGRERSFEPSSLDPYVQRPVGGLHASIDELALFASRFMVGAREVLRPATFADMTRSHVATNEHNVWYGYGVYGLDTPRGPIWTHTGGGRGSTAYFLCAPRQRFAVVAVTNGGRYAGWREVRRAAEEAFLGAPLF